MKVIVIGLDGATFKILEPWAKSGELPGIAKLLKKGSYGVLESSIPFFTSPAWKCYSTGKFPNKLGVYHFLSLDFTNGLIKPVSSTSFRGLEIWDYLGILGFKVAVVNMPTTYPPKKVNGIMISGPVIPSNDYTYPKELRSHIEKLGYKPDNNPAVEIRKHEGLELELAKENIRSKFNLLYEYLLPNDFDFIHLTIFITDTLQHYFFDNKHMLLNLWKEIDKCIVRLLKEVNDNTIIILMSDHGFTKLKGVFYLNSWLEKNGYISLSKRGLILRFMNKLGLYSENLQKLLDKVKLLRLSRKIIPEKLRGSIPNKRSEIWIDFASPLINWHSTRAIMIGEGVIYINPMLSNRDAIVDDLIKKLSSISSPIDGKKVCEKIYKTSELYGSSSGKDPSIIILPAEGYLLKNKIAKTEWSSEIEKWEGTHDPYGIFIAYGKGIKKDYKIKNARIYDIAPTILHIFGCPVPNDMNGRVLIEIFDKNSKFSREPMYVSPSYYYNKLERIRVRKVVKEKIKK